MRIANARPIRGYTSVRLIALRATPAKPQGKWKGDRDEVEDGETMRNDVGGDGGGTTHDEQIESERADVCLCQALLDKWSGATTRMRSWFHFQCVGLSANPKGKGLCPRVDDATIEALIYYSILLSCNETP